MSKTTKREKDIIYFNLLYLNMVREYMDLEFGFLKKEMTKL